MLFASARRQVTVILGIGCCRWCTGRDVRQLELQAMGRGSTGGS